MYQMISTRKYAAVRSKSSDLTILSSLLDFQNTTEQNTVQLILKVYVNSHFFIADDIKVSSAKAYTREK